MIKRKEGLVLSGKGQERRWRRANRFSNREIDQYGNERSPKYDSIVLSDEARRDRLKQSAETIGLGALFGLNGGYNTAFAKLGKSNKQFKFRNLSKKTMLLGTGLGLAAGYGASKGFAKADSSDLDMIAKYNGRSPENPLQIRDEHYAGMLKGAHLVKTGGDDFSRRFGAQMYEKAAQKDAKRQAKKLRRAAR